MSRSASSGQGGYGHGHGHGHGQRARFNDQASYDFTETSSVTNPPELLGIVDEDYDDNISYMSETSSLTGWTTEHSAAPSAPVRQKRSMLDAISEEDSQNFSRVGSRTGSSRASNWSQHSSFGDEDISVAYNEDGVVEAILDKTDAYLPNEAISKAVNLLSPRNKVQSPSNRSGRHRHTIGASDESSIVSNASKKRVPVPPLKDPALDDKEEEEWEEECNCEINPTPMYRVIIARDWKHTTDLLDGKEEDPLWSLPGLNGIHQLMSSSSSKPDVSKMKDYQNKLRAQARTWILHREHRSGVLKWRMLPIHVALTYQAPFEVILRLYHLFPGSIRCRDHRGMLPLHICFFRGLEDRVLELFLDVFPEALDVKDDKGRLPIECTPTDGSDNERRSNIMNLFLTHMLEKSGRVVQSAPKPVAVPGDGATLGARPRYTADDGENDEEAAAAEKLNALMLNAMKLTNQPAQHTDKKIIDRYVQLMGDEENNPGNRHGLAPIHEEGEEMSISALQFGKKRKGIRKMFGKMKV